MKKCILLSVFFLALKISSAQYSLAFCEDVKDDGTPQKASNSFAVSGSGTTVKLLARAEETFGTEQLKFGVYFITTEGNEEEISKFLQTIEPGWNYAWKEISLFNPGTYRVKVYNGKGTYLTSANLSLKRPVK